MIYIIMCTYNGEKYIEKQLESILNNDNNEWRLVIYDDRSTDKTISIIEKYMYEHIGRIECFINNTKKGPKHNFIDAIFEVNKRVKDNDMIMLCDQDDVWFKTKISDTLAVMDRLKLLYGKDVPLLVSGDVTVTDDKLNVIANSYAKSNHFIVKHNDLAHHLMENHVQGCTMMMNKALADLIHDVPQEISMHDDWIATIAYVFGHVEYVDKPLMLYRKTSSSVTSEENGFMAAMKAKVGHLSEQKEYVYKACRQVQFFINIYKEDIPKERLRLLNAFATLEEQSLLKKRFSILKYRLWKSGLLRNVGIILLV